MDEEQHSILIHRLFEATYTAKKERDFRFTDIVPVFAALLDRIEALERRLSQTSEE
jgi:hypothetical protein